MSRRGISSFVSCICTVTVSRVWLIMYAGVHVLFLHTSILEFSGVCVF